MDSGAALHSQYEWNLSRGVAVYPPDEIMSPTHLTPLLKGTVDLLILQALRQGPSHGYEISRFVHERTDGVLTVEEAALYQALHRLEAREWIEAEWGLSDNNRRAKYLPAHRCRPQPAAQRDISVEALCERGLQGTGAVLRCVMKRPSVKRLFRFPTRSPQELAADAREEVQFHVDMRADDLRHRGWTEADARTQAVREFGDLKASIEQGERHERRLERRRVVSRVLGDFRQDVRLAVRLLVRHAGPSAAAILTLAVAIAGNTATFSVANALLFKPLPVTAPQELARVRAGQSHMAWPSYQDLRERTDVFADLVAHRRLRVGLSSPDGLPTRFEGEQTSLNYFDTIGVPPRVGRTYGAVEPRRDVVVLADHTWRARFGADPSITGRILPLNGKLLEVIGVMPAGFRGVAPAGFLTDVWLPMEDGAANTLLQDRRVSRFEVFGRLRPGVTHRAGRRRAADRRPANPRRASGLVRYVRRRPGVRRRRHRRVPRHGQLRPAAAVLPGPHDRRWPAVVLLIACANIAGVLIGRAAARRREIAVRLALGAGRGRLVRQLVTESLVLALAGGGLGVVLALWLLGGVNAAVAQLPVPMALRPPARSACAALRLGPVHAGGAGLRPGAGPAGGAPGRRLVSQGRGRRLGRRGSACAAAWSIAQIAACSALLVWSGLFARSLGRINDVDPGFDPRGVLLARIAVRRPGARARPDGTGRGRRSSAASNRHRTSHPSASRRSSRSHWRTSSSTSSSTARPPARQRLRVMANRLTPGWFETVRIPLLAGRDFTWEDRPGAPDVAILNETFARRFSDGTAVGQRLRVFDRDVQVVGVVRDSKYWTLGETSQPTIYLPFQQHYFRYVTFHVRTSNRAAATALLTADVRQAAPDVFVDVSPMTDVLSVAVFPARVGAVVTGAFGILAMLLAALGVYGLVAFNVAQRTAEIGVRKVVGARAIDLVRLIVSENAALAAVGLGVGLGVGTTGGHAAPHLHRATCHRSIR